MKKPENNFEQKNYHYWNGNKRAKAIGVIVTIPKKYEHLFNEIEVTFVPEDYMHEER